MSLIEVVDRLKKSAISVLPAPWFCTDTAETEPSSMKPNARYFSAMRIGTSGEGAWHDRVFMADIGEWADLKFIIELRNAAPALLDALDFREGDAKLLDTILLQNEIRIQEHRGSILTGAEQQCIRRLATMARAMEVPTIRKSPIVEVSGDFTAIQNVYLLGTPVDTCAVDRAGFQGKMEIATGGEDKKSGGATICEPLHKSHPATAEDRQLYTAGPGPGYEAIPISKIAAAKMEAKRE